MLKLNLKKGGCERWKILLLFWNIRNICVRVKKYFVLIFIIYIFNLNLKVNKCWYIFVVEIICMMLWCKWCNIDDVIMYLNKDFNVLGSIFSFWLIIDLVYWVIFI